MLNWSTLLILSFDVLSVKEKIELILTFLDSLITFPFLGLRRGCEVQQRRDLQDLLRPRHDGLLPRNVPTDGEEAEGEARPVLPQEPRLLLRVWRPQRPHPHLHAAARPRPGLAVRAEAGLDEQSSLVERPRRRGPEPVRVGDRGHLEAKRAADQGLLGRFEAVLFAALHSVRQRVHTKVCPAVVQVQASWDAGCRATSLGHSHAQGKNFGCFSFKLMLP